MTTKAQFRKYVLWIATLALGFVNIFTCTSDASHDESDRKVLSSEQTQVYKDFLTFYHSKVSFATISSVTVSFDDALTDSCAQGFRLERKSPRSNTTHVLPNNIVGQNDRFRVVDSAPNSVTMVHRLTLSEIAFDVSHQHAILRFDYHCGPLCGEGETVVFEKADERWKHIRSCINWIS